MNLRTRTADLGGMAVLAVLVLGLGGGILTRGHDWGGDFAQYVHQAVCIVNGTVEAYVDTNAAMMAASSRAPGPDVYPWGWPLVLSLVVRLRGIDWLAFKGVLVALYLVQVLVVYRGLAAHLRRRDAWLIGLLFSVNPFMLGFLNQVMADLPFTVLSTVALFRIWRAETEPTDRLVRGARALPLGMLIGAALLTRTNGILLLAPLGLVQLKHVIEVARSRGPRTGGGLGQALLRAALERAPGYLAPYAAFAITVAAMGMAYPDGGASHVDRLSMISGATLARNLHYYATLVLVFFEGVPGRHLVCLLFAGLAGVGLMTHGARSLSVVSYIVLTYILYVVWPGTFQGLRHLIPVLPFIAYYSFAGFRRLEARLSPPTARGLRIAGGALLCYLVAAMFVLSSLEVRANLASGREPPEGPYTPEAQAMFTYVKEQAGEGDPVVFSKPRVFHLLTGLPAVNQRYLDRVAPRSWIILYRDQQGLIWPIPKPEMERLVSEGRAEHRYASPRFDVYRLGGEPTS